jgi:3-oxoacyl-[acyl-carrier-protein] synthase-3
MAEIAVIIAGTGSCVPDKKLTNADFAKLVDTSDEWIVQRTGMKERRVVSEGESTATLGASAARRAIAAAGIKPEDIDLIVTATVTPEMGFPSTACFIAKDLGLTSTPAFDITAACSGFIYALEIGSNFIKSGKYKNVLVIGAETLTRITDYQDRASCILFGDGAGAVVLQASNETGRGMLYSSLHADGHGWQLLHYLPGSRYPISKEMIEKRDNYMKINGRDVYKFAVSRFTELIEDAMAKCKLTIEDIKLVVPHQVNQRIIDSALEKIGLPKEKAFVNLDMMGNTSAASIPIALDEAVRAGKLQKGDLVIFVAFGGGLTWANAVFRM